MKRLIHGCVILSALVGTFGLRGQMPAVEPSVRYIVSLKAGESIDSVTAHHGLIPHRAFQEALHGFVIQISAGQVAQLQFDDRIATIAPDYRLGAFEQPAGSEFKEESTQEVPGGVSRVGAAPGDVAFTGAGVGVAVLDTGLDFQHPDLQPLGKEFYCVPEYGDSAQDNEGHGTHVGGIIAARDNQRDVVGVAPQATLYAVKVLDHEGLGYDSDMIAGLEWVLANGAQLNPLIKVVNLSLGRFRSDHDSLLHGVIARVVDSGITVVVAAGNDPGYDVRDMVPAGFPEVITVASTTARTGRGNQRYGAIRADTASSFTTDGRMDRFGVGVAISAPGEEREDVDAQGWIHSVGILSTRLGGGTLRMSGTSMATPHVAGVVALMYEQEPTLLPVEAKLKVMRGALIMTVPYDAHSTTRFAVPDYSFDGDREGILSAPEALSTPLVAP